MTEERITVTINNKRELEDEYSKGKISAIIHAIGPFPNRLVNFPDEFRKRTPYFDFNIGDIVIKK